MMLTIVCVCKCFESACFRKQKIHGNGMRRGTFLSKAAVSETGRDGWEQCGRLKFSSCLPKQHTHTLKSISRPLLSLQDGQRICFSDSQNTLAFTSTMEQWLCKDKHNPCQRGVILLISYFDGTRNLKRTLTFFNTFPYFNHLPSSLASKKHYCINETMN